MVPALSRSCALLIPCVMVACKSPSAPIQEGSYLTYLKGTTVLEVRFSAVDEDHFRAAVDVGTQREELRPARGAIDGTEEATIVVDKQLRTPAGEVLSPSALGPLWIPPERIKPGSRAQPGSSDSISAVTKWRRWTAGIVKAKFGAGGALRGTWYYDKQTGFLVGMQRSSAVQPKGSLFALHASNIASLAP